MKTLLIAWATALLLYTITPAVMADEQNSADFIDVWKFSEGNICITIQDRLDHTDARAELWLVNNYEVEWVKDVQGHSCINLDLEEDSNLHIITYDPRIIISVVDKVANDMLLSQL